MKYLIIGTGLSGNLGAQAMVQSTIEYINKRDPEAKTHLLSFNAASDRELASQIGLNIEIHHLKLLLWISQIYFSFFFYLLGLRPFAQFFLGDLYDKYNQSDYILEITGISFNDHQGIATSVKHLAWIIPGMIAGKMSKYIKLSQAAGPFEKFFNRRIAKYAFNKLDHFRARGLESLEKVLSLSPKFKEKDFIYAPDLSFLLEPCSKLEAEALMQEEGFMLDESMKYVGVSPNLVQLDFIGENGMKLLYDEVAQMLNYLINQGYEIVFIPHSYLRTENSKSIEKKLMGLSRMLMDDAIFIQEVHERIIDKQKTHKLLKNKFAYQTKGIFKLMDFNIVMRFHSMIGSLGAGISCFVISWSHKYTEVMREFDLEKYVIDAKDFSFLKYKKLLDEFISIHVEKKVKVEESLVKVKEMSKLNFNIIASENN